MWVGGHRQNRFGGRLRSWSAEAQDRTETCRIRGNRTLPVYLSWCLTQKSEPEEKEEDARTSPSHGVALYITRGYGGAAVVLRRLFLS